MTINMRMVCFALLSICFSAVMVSAGSAQTSDKTKAITIEPFLQEVILEPGDASKSFAVQVTNNTSSPFSFTASAVDFGSLNESGGIFFTGSESVKLANKYGLANWIEIEQKDMELAPGQKTKVNVTLLNRSNLSPGGHYGAIFINSTGAGGSSEAEVSFRQSISALVLAIKRGGEKYDLGLSSINNNGRWYKAPTEVTLRFKNTGNTHVVPRGIVNITGEKDTIYAKGVINETSSYILPETYRQMSVPLKIQKSYPFQLIQSHKIEVNYRYDGLDRFAAKTYTVRWVNWPFLATLILLLVAAFLSINYLFGDKIEKRVKTAIKKVNFKK